MSFSFPIKHIESETSTEEEKEPLGWLVRMQRKCYEAKNDPNKKCVYMFFPPLGSGKNELNHSKLGFI